MSRDLLPGFTPWPDEFAAYYRRRGYWSGITLGDMLRESRRSHPERLALVCGTRRWSYAELDRRVDGLAAGFGQLGIRSSDRVVVQLPNVAEFVVTCFALFRIGALPVFALPAHRRAEIGHFCSATRAVAYVIADVEMGFDYRGLARQISAEVTSLTHVIVVGDAQEFVAFDNLCNDDTPASGLVEPGPGDVAFLHLSGGSTGVPKLIPRTHDDYLYSIRESARICDLDQDSVYLCALPAAHNFPMSSPGTFGTLLAGGCVVLARRPAPDEAFGLISRERVTITALVPPLAMLWLDAIAHRRPGANCADLGSLQLIQVGGSRLTDEAARRIGPSFGCRLQQVFGMAEGLVCYTGLDDPEAWVVTTQGRPISPDDEVRIVDDEDRDLPPGEAGHLLTRGPYTIRGYYDADAHNAHAFTHDGYYRTGDIVRRLPSGHLIVEGRVKDQINRGGDKIAAEDVENHLLAHPAVHDAALVAMPDTYLGEKACAFVIARGAAPDAKQLRDFLRGRGIAEYKIPERFVFVECFPKTAVGKVDKRELRERLARPAHSPPSPLPA